MTLFTAKIRDQLKTRLTAFKKSRFYESTNHAYEDTCRASATSAHCMQCECDCSSSHAVRVRQQSIATQCQCNNSPSHAVSVRLQPIACSTSATTAHRMQCECDSSPSYAVRVRLAITRVHHIRDTCSASATTASTQCRRTDHRAPSASTRACESD